MRTGFVYLIRDEALAFTKIGFSVSPNTRERTLQGEKPTLRLLRTWPARESLERALHKHFAAQRIRGEWFDLSSDDLASFDAIVAELTSAQGPIEIQERRVLTISTTAVLLDAVAVLARKDGRSVSNYINWVLAKHLKQLGQG